MIAVFSRSSAFRRGPISEVPTNFSLRLDGHELKVSLDETPMGDFIEIEGDEATILRVLEAAGFSSKDIIRESYPELQFERCRARGIPLEDLVF